MAKKKKSSKKASKKVSKKSAPPRTSVVKGRTAPLSADDTKTLKLIETTAARVQTMLAMVAMRDSTRRMSLRTLGSFLLRQSSSARSTL